MKFSEDIIKGFNLDSLEEKEPVNVMQGYAAVYEKLC